MAVQSLRKQESRNPRTLEEARALVKHVESLFMPWNIDALADGFTEDCVVRFGSVPEIQGPRGRARLLHDAQRAAAELSADQAAALALRRHHRQRAGTAPGKTPTAARR